MKKQLQQFKTWLIEQNIDGAFLNDPATVAYLTGYQSDPHERILALLVFPHEAPFLFTPALEIEDAKNSEWDQDVFGYLDNENPWALIASHINERVSDFKKMAVEKNFLTLDRFEALKNLYPSVEVQDASSIIQHMQLIKTEDEIKKMVEAGEWADKALEIGFQSLEAGKSEQEIVAEIEYQLKKMGIREMSFETMVLTGDKA